MCQSGVCRIWQWYSLLLGILAVHTQEALEGYEKAMEWSPGARLRHYHYDVTVTSKVKY